MEEGNHFSIVIAEELPLLGEGIARVCERQNQYHIVARCSDGRAALEAIQFFRPDLAILGLDMRELSSFEIIRNAAEADVLTRFLVMAKGCDRKTLTESFRAGASGVLLRSTPPTQLAEALRRVSSGSSYVPPEFEFHKLFVTRPHAYDIARVETLSSREHEVFRLLVDGVRPKEIAYQLAISPKTVDTYRASLMRKLGINSIAGLVKFAVEHKMLG
jgi:DNA-binding NarL/FixJ family response regulator